MIIKTASGTEAWAEKPDLIHSDGSDEQGKHFVIETDELGNSVLRFGDGINGAIPVANAANPGANVVAAIQLAERLGPGATVVTLMADSGLKYLNTDVYRRSQPDA